MRLPSGRKIAYPFARNEAGTDKFDRPATVVHFMDNAGGKWTDARGGQGAWPGLWAENVVQAVARDLLAAAMLRLEAAGYPIVLHVHDEIVAEVPDGFGSEEEFVAHHHRIAGLGRRIAGRREGSLRAAVRRGGGVFGEGRGAAAE